MTPVPRPRVKFVQAFSLRFSTPALNCAHALRTEEGEASYARARRAQLELEARAEKNVWDKRHTFVCAAGNTNQNGQ